MPKVPRRPRGRHKPKSGPAQRSETPLLRQFRGDWIWTGISLHSRDTYFEHARDGQGTYKSGPKSYWRPFRNGLPVPRPGLYEWDGQKLVDTWAARIARRNLRQAEEEYGIDDTK